MLRSHKNNRYLFFRSISSIITGNEMKTDPIEYFQPVIEVYTIILGIVILIPVLIFEKVEWLYRKAKGN
jgi:hypothetical protein